MFLLCFNFIPAAVYAEGTQAGNAGSSIADSRIEELQKSESFELKSTDELLRDIVRHQQRKERGILEVQNPDQLLKYLVRKKWYRYTEEDRQRTGTESLESLRQNDADLTSVRESASDQIKSIIVLLGEIPISDQKAVYAPVFLTDQKGIFGTRTDLSFTWVGYKTTLKLTQKKFPWDKTSLNETIIGSFLYASGTNLGFVSGNLKEENRFYTNYISEIVTLTWLLPANFSVGFALDSRQYFFVERDVPNDFVMPKNHVNVFPRIDLGYDRMTEKGIDQLTEGLRISAWIGYGIRNRWDTWGSPEDPQMGDAARTFSIYSYTLTYGYLFWQNHNTVLRLRYKGGVDNDFLTRPRFGGTIDNANLDVVHGFTIDSFRVNNFGLANFRYGFDIFRRLRFTVFLDYAHVFSPEREEVVGSAYGFRIISFGGLPIWLTHGIGRKLYPSVEPFEHVVTVMTAAGW